MKSSAASREDGLYRLYADEDGNPDNEPTRVGYQLAEARQAHLCDERPASVPPRQGPTSFFPPDDPNRVITPPAISGEYNAVRLEDFVPRSPPPESFPPTSRPIESVPPIDKTFNIRFHEKQQLRRTSSDSFGFGWMLGLAFLSASTVFVWLWFVARWLVH